MTTLSILKSQVEQAYGRTLTWNTAPHDRFADADLGDGRTVSLDPVGTPHAVILDELAHVTKVLDDDGREDSTGDLPTQQAVHWCRFDESFRLQVLRQPTRAELDREILFLWQVRDACRMAIAELVCLGEDTFGQKYAPAQLSTGRAYDTLAGWVRVWRHVAAQGVWRDELSYSYHKAVAYKELSPGTKEGYLERAVAGEFESAADLNRTLREECGLIDPPIALSVRCPVCGEPLTDKDANRKCMACGSKPVEWAEAYWRLRDKLEG